MSIIKNGKIIAGNYNVSSASDATEEKKGIIRIATDEEAKAGELTNVAITPKQLAENSGGLDELPIATTEVLGGVKPDGETITITEDGTISSVSSSSEIDAYTKSETDILLEEKQDKLTSNAPIQLSDITLSNSYGYTYKEDGTMQPDTGASWNLSNNIAKSSYSNYIDFPLDLDKENNKFVMYPDLMSTSGATNYANQALGKLDSDGNFYPIVILNPVGDNYNANSSRYWVASSLAINDVPVTMYTKQGGTASSSTNEYLNTGDITNPRLIAFGFQKVSSTQINISSTAYTYTQNMTVNSNLVNEINCFRVLNRYSGIDGIVKPQFIGLYQGSSTVATNGSILRLDVKNAIDGLLTNEADIASYTTVHQIKLNYDDTLKVVDGKLSANLDTSSLVTTDTNQTITGTKVFNESVQYSNPQYYKDVWIGQTGPGNFGLVFQSNNSPYEFYIYNQGYTASSLNVSGFGGGVKFADTINFNSSIYDKDGNEIVGGNSGGGGSVDTSNLVDLTTNQTITANKTIGYGKQLKLESGTTSYNGAVYGGTSTAGNMILECQNQTGAIPESIIIGAQGNGANYSRRGIFLSVPSNEAIYLGDVSSACKVEAVNDLKLYGGYKQNSYLHLSNDELKYTKSDGTSVDLLNSSGGSTGGALEFEAVKGYYTDEDEGLNDHYYIKHIDTQMVIAGGIVAPTGPDGYVVINFEKPFDHASLLVINHFSQEIPWYALIWDNELELYTGFEAELNSGEEASWMVFGY